MLATGSLAKSTLAASDLAPNAAVGTARCTTIVAGASGSKARATASIKAIGAAPASGNILNVPNVLAQSDVLGATSAASVLSWVEVNIGLPNGSGGVIWNGWQKFVPGNYYGRYFWFRFWTQVSNVQTIAYLLSASGQASVGARIDHYQNLSVPAGGLTITFQPDNAATVAPFNKGPNGAALPFYQITYPNEGGDQLIVSALSLSAISFQILNAGVGVARTGLNLTVEGY